MKGSEILVYFQLHNKFETILDNKRACLKRKKKESKKEKEI